MGPIQDHTFFDGSFWKGDGTYTCEQHSYPVVTTVCCEENGDTCTVSTRSVFNNDCEMTFINTRTVKLAGGCEAEWEEQNAMYGLVYGKFVFAEQQISSIWNSSSYSGKETLTKLNDRTYKIEGSSQGVKKSSWKIVFTQQGVNKPPE